MFQFPAQEDHRARSSRPRAPALRPIPSNPNLPAIDEKDGDIEIKLESLSPDPLSEDAFSPPLVEKYMTYTETPMDGPVSEPEVLMDKFGFPLSPQPLVNDPNDPLTWSRVVKIKILIQISLLSFLSLFTAQAIVGFLSFV